MSNSRSAARQDLLFADLPSSPRPTRLDVLTTCAGCGVGKHKPLTAPCGGIARTPSGSAMVVLKGEPVCALCYVAVTRGVDLALEKKPERAPVRVTLVQRFD